MFRERPLPKEGLVGSACSFALNCLSFFENRRFFPPATVNDDLKAALSEIQAHGYRTASILIKEFGVLDPWSIVVAFLHDLPRLMAAKQLRLPESAGLDDFACLGSQDLDYQKIEQELYDILRQVAIVYTNSKLFTEFEVDLRSIAQNLVSFFQLSNQHSKTGLKVLEESPHPLDLAFATERNVDPVKAFSELLEEVATNFLGNTAFTDLKTLIEQCRQAVEENNGSFVNLNVILTLLAQAIDRYRHPSWDQLNHLSISPREREVAYALEALFVLLPMAYLLDIPEAINAMGELIYPVLFRQYWAAFERGLAQLEAVLRCRSNKSRVLRHDPFQVFKRANVMALLKKVHEFLQQGGIDNAVYVDSLEFQERVREQLRLNPRGEKIFYPKSVLKPKEWTVLSSLKSPSSIFFKWIKKNWSGKLLLTDGLVEFLNEERWLKYLLLELTDLFRAKIILGADLAYLFTYGESCSRESTSCKVTPLRPTIWQLINQLMIFPYDGEEVPFYLELGDKTVTPSLNLMINCVRLGRIGSNRDRSLEMLFPFSIDQEGQPHFEAHVVLNLLEDLSLEDLSLEDLSLEDLRPPFEVHVEPITHFLRGNFGAEGEQTHTGYKPHAFYKLKALFNGSQDMQLDLMTSVLNTLKAEMMRVVS